nr:hypothetical protein GCM10023233_29490 [Brevibacterium otitidis]
MQTAMPARQPVARLKRSAHRKAGDSYDDADDESECDEDGGDDPRGLLVLLVTGQRAALLVARGADEDHDEVDERPDAQSAGGQQLGDRRADLAEVEAIGAERAEEVCQ